MNQSRKVNHQLCLFKQEDFKNITKLYTFDSVYGDGSLQESVYFESAFLYVESVLEGYSGAFLA